MPPAAVQLRIQPRQRQLGETGESLSLARAMLECAREKSAELLRESDRSRNESHHAGWQAGFEQGLSSLNDQLETAKQIGIAAARDSKAAMLEIVFALTEEILGETVKLHSEALTQRISYALEILENESDFSIHLHPSDADALRSKEFRVVADRAVPPGTAQLKNSNGLWEVSPQKRLERIKELLGNNA